MPDNYLDSRTCMAKLNEHCQKNLLKLEYKDIDITGPPHDRVFTVAVVIGTVQYESAIGKTKKEAKAEAAVLAWNTIQKQKKGPTSSCLQANDISCRSSEGELDSCQQHKESTLSPLSPSVPECTSPNSINYVSLLNEYALKNKVGVQYNMISKTGLDHKPVFSYACRIGDKVFDVGRGNKVQVAKLEAAKLAYEKLTSSSTFRAEEHDNSLSDSSDMTFSSSQGQSSEASGSSTDLDSELKKTSDTFTEDADAIQLNETSSSQNLVSSPSQSMKPKRKETPLAAKFSKLSTKTSKFTKNERFLKEFCDIEEIGSGGFGNVFKGRNIIDDRLCAIKRIRLSNKEDDGKREVKALATLDHLHVVKYYCCWTGKDIFQFPDTSGTSKNEYDCLFISMELCGKGNLSNWLRKKKEDSCEGDSIILFKQIVEGVKYIHSKDLIHRDLKPLNIFFDNENNIKIGDFGLVTSGVNDVSVQRTVNKGTLNYMAPEQEGCNYGKEVDLFPLGLILYEMLFPFSCDHEKSKEWPKIKEGNLPEKFTKKFTTETYLIKKLLSKGPTERPSAAIILGILKGQPHGLHSY